MSAEYFVLWARYLEAMARNQWRKAYEALEGIEAFSRGGA